jgi:hypothetical protein
VPTRLTPSLSQFRREGDDFFLTNDLGEAKILFPLAPRGGETAMWELDEQVFFELCTDAPYPVGAAVFFEVP